MRTSFLKRCESVPRIKFGKVGSWKLGKWQVSNQRMEVEEPSKFGSDVHGCFVGSDKHGWQRRVTGDLLKGIRHYV
ncbi:hypothetical protein KI387_017386, partial [Taxus chinensis]